MSFFIARTNCTLPRPPRVRHKSFTAQPLDLLSWHYVYLLGFDLSSNLARHLASYPVSVRRLKNFATPLPPSIPLLIPTCGSLHLAVNTRDWTCTSKISAMLGTLQKNSPPSSEEFSTSHFTFYSITITVSD